MANAIERTRSDFANIVGGDWIFHTPSDMAPFGKDWAKGFVSNPSLVLFPGSIDEVRAIVLYCAQHHLPLVPSGGRTGVAGGAVAAQGEVVLALERLNRILDVDVQGATITCEAGVVTQRVQQSARNHGLFYPIHLTSAGSCHIGGNIATNAGGIHVIRYGHTAKQVLGLKVVTGSGDVLTFSPLHKNPTGLNLMPHFIGSEGILGIVVEATLQLQPLPYGRRRFLLGLRDMPQLLLLRAAMRQIPFPLLAFEFFERAALEYVLAHRTLPEPFTTRFPLYVTLEVEEGKSAPATAAESMLESLLQQGACEDAVFSTSEKSFHDLMAYREFIGEVLASHYTPLKNDLAVSPGRVGEFYEKLRDLQRHRFPQHKFVLFGHIADGNIHTNVLAPEGMVDEEFFAQFPEINEALYTLTRDLGGTIAAEHGVGLLKQPYLQLCRSKREIEIMRDLKKIYDPSGILNPGKVL